MGRVATIVNGKDVRMILINGVLSESNIGVVTVAESPDSCAACQFPINLMVGWCILFAENIRCFRQMLFQRKGQQVYKALT